MDDMGLVITIAVKMWKRTTKDIRRIFDLDDFVSEGTLALITCRSKWDGIRPFSTFAGVCIKNRILEAIKLSKIRRFSPSLLPDNFDLTINNKSEEELNIWWFEMLEALDEQEKLIILQHYRYSKKFELIGKDIGEIERRRVNEIHTKILNKLRKTVDPWQGKG